MTSATELKTSNPEQMANLLHAAADILAAPLEFPADDEAGDKPDGKSQAEEGRA